MPIHISLCIFLLWRYKINTNLSTRVGFFNPGWNDSNPVEKEEVNWFNKLTKPENKLLLYFQTGFKQAMQLIGTEFLDKFHYYIRQWWPARALLEQAIAKRFEVRSIHWSTKVSEIDLRLIHPVLYLFSTVHFRGVNICLILKLNKKILLAIQLNMYCILTWTKLGVSKLFHWTTNHSIIDCHYQNNGKAYAMMNWARKLIYQDVCSCMHPVLSVVISLMKVF